MNETDRELIEAIDEIKDLWQQGEFLDMPEPIERARALVRQESDDASADDREDALRGYVSVEDLYSREELHARAIEDAASDLERFDVPMEEAQISWAMVEDGVLHYGIEHENIPIIQYGEVVNDRV